PPPVHACGRPPVSATPPPSRKAVAPLSAHADTRRPIPRKHAMNPRMKLLPLMLLAISQGVLAQQLPGAGSQLRQLPPAQQPPQTEPQVRIEDSTAPAPAVADATSVVVNQLQVTGARAYPAEQLVSVAGFEPGATLTLAQMQEMAARITRHYRS